MIKKIIKLLWIGTFLFILGNVLIFYSISKGWIGYIPPIAEMENPKYKFATEVFSDDGEVIGRWAYSRENRVFTKYDDLSRHLVNALVATEDVRFSEHSGIDGKAIVRAIVKTGVMMQKSSGGGSTISQQLAKLLFTGNVAENKWQRILIQKPNEWVIAVHLERFYTKEEIITMYLNKFDFLNNAVGVKTASNIYFGCDPIDLKIEEAATLIGMCKNPSLYNPVRFNERTKNRRNVVLDQMRKAKYITKEQADSLKQLPLKLRYTKIDHKDGIAAYLREYLRGMMTAKKPDKSKYRGWQKQKFYEDSLAWETNPLYGWCNKNVKKDGSNYNIYTDGLKVYTTINSKMQRYAEEAVKEHVGEYLQPRFFKEKKGRNNAPYSRSVKDDQVKSIINKSIKQSDRYRVMKENGFSDEEINKAFNTPEPMTVFSWNGLKDTIMTPTDSIKYYKHFIRTGFMSMDPNTGYVKAYVGGINYSFFQYDMAMVGRRQVGSTIKPYLYTLAMENGMTPCDQVRHVEQTLFDENGRAWTPRNATRKNYGEMVSLRWGLANSSNWVSAYLMDKLNPYALVKLIHNFGVLNRDIQPTVSLCLGPCEISVGEMVSAYTAFANKGLRVSPLFVTRIEDKDGNIISTFSPQVSEVISAEAAYKVLSMLKSVINEGTGGRLRRYGVIGDVAGKTGTTNDNSDAWFMGFTPSLVSGCWVGGEDRDIHFDSMEFGQGASSALPIWAKYMLKIYADQSLGYTQSERFVFPEDFNPCAENISFDYSDEGHQHDEIDENFQ